jgi:uncharacterized protein YcnI
VRCLLAAPAAAAALLLLPGTAAADVQVAASHASSGARDVTITFRVTNDDPAVPTTRLQVFLPPAKPLLGVAPTAPKGWTASVTTAPPPSPTTVEGETVGQVATAVEWSGGRLDGTGYAVFPIDVDRLPEGAGPLRFRVLQTYADGDVVEWSDTIPAGAPPPAHPSLLVPYADAPLPPAGPGAPHGHHGGGAVESGATGPADAGSVGETLALALAVVALLVGGAAALGRRQQRRFRARGAAGLEPVARPGSRAGPGADTG